MMLTQVFEYLIDNAIKYKDANNPVIDINAEHNADSWIFYLSDNGLAIVKKIIERHGGKIWVQSEQGQGSQFYFTVPKANYPSKHTSL